MRDDTVGDREDEQPAPQPPDAQAARRVSVDQRMASVTSRGTFAAFQLGATLVASAGGLIIYGLLVNGRVNNFIALLVGLAFALLARRAATSLMLMWLGPQARRRGAAGEETPPPPGTPSPPA